MRELRNDDWGGAFRFLRAQGLSLPDQDEERLRVDLEQYLVLLLKKNEVVNLTAIRDLHTGLWKHIVDSLLLCHAPPAGVVLDWGSGGGLPGIPLALYRRVVGESSPVFFLDSVGKKLKAIEEFCGELGLSTEYFHERGEAFLARANRPHIDSIVMRAVAPPERAIQWLSPVVPHWIFFLGPQQRDEWEKALSQVSKTFESRFSKEFILPRDMGSRFFLYLDSKCST